MSEILITIEDGVIQSVDDIPAGVTVRVMDFDTDGSDPNDTNIKRSEESGDLYYESIYESDAQPTRYFGNNSWQVSDVITQGREEYDIEISETEATSLLENLSALDHTGDIAYGWELIDEAIEEKFPDVLNED